MAIDSFPNTPHNNRAISLAENEQLLAPLGPTGLVGYTGTTPVYGDSTGRQVKVRAGVSGNIRGTRFNNAAETIVTLTTNTSGSPRVDLLVARLSRTNYTVSYVVIVGTPAATPIAPQPVRNDTVDGTGVWDLPLAEIKVGNGYTTVAPLDVTNRAWWVSSSGYHGLAAAAPPVEPGAIWRANDAGITYVGTSGGSWQKLYYNTGWKPLGVPAGWTAQAFHFCRVGDLVVMNARLVRTGAAIAGTSSAVFGPLGSTYRPSMAVYGVYHCSFPDHSSHIVVGTDGLITFSGTSDTALPISQNATLLANMVWPAAEA